jgi:hypothetical protein
MLRKPDFREVDFPRRRKVVGMGREIQGPCNKWIVGMNGHVGEPPSVSGTILHMERNKIGSSQESCVQI